MFDELLEACRRNDWERVEALVTADPTLLTRQADTGETPLLAALYHRSGSTVSWLAAQQWPRTIHEAAAIDDTDRLADILASSRDDADTYSADGWTPLHLAAFFGSTRAAELLLSHGASPGRISRNYMANTCLHAAIAAKDTRMIKLLLDAGADPAIHCAGYTPLALAEQGHFEPGAQLIRQALSPEHRP